MEFWGVEVKPGQTVKYEVTDNKYLHLSQATLGEGKKENRANESAIISVNFDDKKLVIGTLSAEKCPQISYDLVFEKGFELSHTWKNGSVFFAGYKVASEGFRDITSDELSDDTDSEFEYEESPVAKESKEVLPKAKAKADAKAVEVKKGKEEDDDDDSDDDGDYSGDESDDEVMLNGEGDSDEEEEDDSSEEENEATPPKKVNEKKRGPGEPGSKTPVVEKKAKVVGGEGKKGGSGHPATPYPTKQISKTPAVAEDKSKKKQQQNQTPKSGGSVSCPSCPKTFKDEQALKSHSQAKHPAS